MAVVTYCLFTQSWTFNWFYYLTFSCLLNFAIGCFQRHQNGSTLLPFNDKFSWQSQYTSKNTAQKAIFSHWTQFPNFVSLRDFVRNIQAGDKMKSIQAVGFGDPFCWRFNLMEPSLASHTWLSQMQKAIIHSQETRSDRECGTEFVLVITCALGCISQLLPAPFWDLPFFLF